MGSPFIFKIGYIRVLMLLRLLLLKVPNLVKVKEFWSISLEIFHYISSISLLYLSYIFELKNDT